MATGKQLTKGHHRCQSCGGSTHNSPFRSRRRTKSEDCASIHSADCHFTTPKEIRIIAGKNTVSVTFTDEQSPPRGSFGKAEIPSRVEKRSGSEMSLPLILRKETSNECQIQIPSSEQHGKPVSVSVPGISVSVSPIKSEGDLTKLKPHIGNLAILRGEPYSSHTSALRRRRSRRSLSCDRGSTLNCLDEEDELVLDKPDQTPRRNSNPSTRRPLLKFASNNEDSDSSSLSTSSTVSHIEPNVRITPQNIRYDGVRNTSQNNIVSNSTNTSEEHCTSAMGSRDLQAGKKNVDDSNLSDTTNSTPTRSPRVRKLRWKNETIPSSTDSSSGYESQVAKCSCANKHFSDSDTFRSPRASRSSKKGTNSDSDCSVHSAPGALNAKHVRWYAGETVQEYRTMPLDSNIKKKDKKRRQRP